MAALRHGVSLLCGRNSDKALAAKKMKVSATFVGSVKRAVLGGKGRPNKNGRAAAGALTLDDLVTAKEFSRRLGGAARAKQALDALAKLQ